MASSKYVRLFAFVILAALCRWSTAQTTTQTTNGAVDLSSPSLAVHASLPQYNRPGGPLTDALTRAQAVATAKSITSSHGLEVTTYDDVGDAAGVTVSLISNMYRRLACSADAIVVGHPNTWEFHLSTPGTAIYGDYDISVDSVLKDNNTTPYVKGPHIIVTRLGGTMTLGTGTVNQVVFTDESYPAWQLGTTYLIFLRLIPATGAFQPIDAFSTFIGGANAWTIARKAYARVSLFTFSRGTFEQTIKQWSSLCGK